MHVRHITKINPMTFTSKSITFIQKLKASSRILWGWLPSTIELPLGRIGLFCYFISYGYYGSVSPRVDDFSSAMWSLAISLILSIPLIFSPYFIRNYENITLTIKVGSEDIVRLSILIIFLGLISWPQLNFWLYCDELSYAGSAHGHAIEVGFVLVSKISALSSLPFKWIVQALSIIFIALLYFCWGLTASSENRLRINLLLIIFLLMRLAFAIKGGNGNPHPPMELLPLLFSGGVLGISSLTFKVAIFFSNAVLLVTLYRILIQKLSPFNAYIAIAIVATLPLVLNLSSVVDHSYWGYFFTCLIVAYIFTDDRPDFRRLILIIAIGSLFRLPVFLLLIPTIFLFVESQIKDIRGIFFNLIKLSYPILIFLPMLLKSVIMGTPATGAMDTLIRPAQVWEAISSWYVFDAFIQSYGYFSLIPLFLCFIPFQKSIKVALSMALLFLTQILIFYSIEPVLWDMKKYQVELYAPYILVGIASLFLFLNKKQVPKYIWGIFSIILVSINLTKSYQFSQVINSNDQKTINNLPSVSYNYDEAYNYVIQKGMSANTLSIGKTYGVLPEIMAGYTGSETLAAKALYDKNKAIGDIIEELAVGDVTAQILKRAENISADQSIRVILVQSMKGDQLLLNALSKFNWEVKKILFVEYSKTHIFILERKS